MELVPLSTTVLETLAREDCRLRPVFRGVYAADRLPRQTRDKGYIVNTDPHDRPVVIGWDYGWIGPRAKSWTVMDSPCGSTRIPTFTFG